MRQSDHMIAEALALPYWRDMASDEHAHISEQIHDQLRAERVSDLVTEIEADRASLLMCAKDAMDFDLLHKLRTGHCDFAREFRLAVEREVRAEAERRADDEGM